MAIIPLSLLYSARGFSRPQRVYMPCRRQGIMPPPPLPALRMER